ncbi:MAG: C25 family cysteine peptidase [Chitinispirillia bacterium]|nr:C25 family cysteine peptidase [Chitinispirillia bacterium]
MRYSIFRIAILLFISVYWTAHASVTVIESTPSRLVLSWKMEGFQTVTVKTAQDGDVTALSFNGGYVLTGDSGASAIPGFSLYAGVPPQGNIRVTLDPQETSVLRIGNPLQKRISAKNQPDPTFSSRWISAPSYSSMRDYRTVSLVIRPISDLGGGRIQLLRSARIVIDFPPSSHNGAVWEPKSDYERMVRRLLSNFNVSQGWQQSERPALRRALEMPDPFPLTVSQQFASFKVSSAERGNEASTRGNKLIKISGSKIRELFDGNVQIGSVALYASTKGELNDTVPRWGQIPAGVFEIPLLRPNRAGTDAVRDDDYFIAYVSGSSDWSYTASPRRYSFVLNRYDDKRTFWLTVKTQGLGAAMERFVQPQSTAAVDTTFDANIYMREPRALSAGLRDGSNDGGGIDWVWKRFDTGRADTTVSLDLPGLLENRTGSISFDFNNAFSRNITARLGSASICSSCANNTWWTINTNRWGSSDLTIDGQNAESAELRGVHIRYRRPIAMPGSAAGERLEIFSDTASRAVRYRLTKTGSDTAFIVRVPLDERDVTLIADTVVRTGFTWSDAGNQGTRYIVMSKNSIVDYSDSLKRVGYQSAGSSFLIRDLRGTVYPGETRTDYLIITHEDFLDAALRLAEHKRDNAGFKYPKVVLLSDLLNQFSGGNMDPTAIRNFLLFVYRNWDRDVKLDYVTLFGLGHYDYKSVTTRQMNFMPVAYRTNGATSSHKWATDDYFVFLDTLSHPDRPSRDHQVHYFIGRLPAKSLTEALNIVEKIREMENVAEADLDSWRNRVLLTADDDQQREFKDHILDHHSASERIARTILRNRPATDIRKVYMYEYPWDDFWAKPTATRAFINEINNGVAAVNWLGHGSNNQLADEPLFAMADVLALHNRKRYPVFSLFSCSIGKFDLPGVECLSAQLVRQPRAGAIGVISATRVTLRDPNERLAEAFYEALFDSTDNMSVGAALRIGKYSHQHVDDRYYVLLGDPSITLSRQNRNVDLEIVNSSGEPVIDTLKALQQITIKGSVNRFSGQMDRDFTAKERDSAFVNIILFNAPDTAARRKDGGVFSDPRYELPGAPVFSAKIAVDSGRFEQTLRLPMNLSFGKPGVKLTAYAFRERDTLMGTGALKGLVFAGSETGNLSDTTGPKISVRPIYSSNSMDSLGFFVKTRIRAQLPLTLEIRVEDESGVNVIGSGPDEGLTIEVLGSLSKRSIAANDFCLGGDYRCRIATVNYEENTLKSGVHELVVTAQDLLGNVSRQSFTLEIVDPMDIKLDHVLNIPNPVRMGRETRFFFHHSNVDRYNNEDLIVIIRVYSLGGRLLAVIRPRYPRDLANGYLWIPRDNRGNMLTPNVYLYQVSVTSPSLGKTTKSKIKKLVVHPPPK